MLEFRILGSLEVLTSGEAVSLGAAGPRTLLALLLVNAGESLSVDRVIDELWGKRPPATAQDTVQAYASSLRNVLRVAGERMTLQGSAAGYRLDVDPEQIDARRFEALIAEAERLAGDDPAHARAVFADALALWRGPPLAEFAQYEFAAREADRLKELRATALEESVQFGSARRESARSPQPGALERAFAIVEPGARVEASPADLPFARQSRRVVTALFCDVTGSTALGEELDPEALHGVMNRYFRELRAVIERHGGSVEKFIGDAVMAVFGIPQLREDDALRAVRAAWEIREQLPLVAEEVGVVLTFRTALNTGEVLSGGGENLAIGDAVNVAARLEQSAAPGEILLGPETLRLVRDAVRVQELEPLMLKGKSEPMRVYRLLSVDPRAPGRVYPLNRPLVDRERELDLVRRAWERTVQESGCHLFTLLGVAGVGKSRLAAEVLSDASDVATVLRGRCLHYGEGITFWPLVEALGPVGEPANRTLDHLASGGAATPEELFWEVRLLLESLARERPLILHIDDLQWAEQMLLDLLDHIVELSRGVPILLLCTARPELLDDRPNWSGGKLNATTALLEPLGTGECEILLDQLGDGIDTDLRERVIAASEGNPLFLEELAVLARERRRLVIPSTIQALLAARLDRLPAEQRELLERGAVEGEVFHRSSLHALTGEVAAAELDRRLAALVRQDLIRPHPPTFEDDEAFRFRHILIRDAAHDGLPKALRAHLHERLAGWLEERSSVLPEVDEIAGWHLEHAVRYHRELGSQVDRVLPLRAAEHLHAAGRRASWRGDVAAAVNLLERALALASDPSALSASGRAVATTEDGEPLRGTISIELAERLIEAGELTRAQELLATAEQDSARAQHGPVVLNWLEWLVLTRPEQAAAAVESRLPAMLAELARIGDDRRIAKAHMLAFWVHWASNHAVPAAEQARLAAEHARKVGDNALRSRALGWYVATIIYGPQNADVIARELDAIEQEGPGPYLGACVDLGRGEVERLYGRFADAHALTQRAFDRFTALGMRPMAAGCAQELAHIELSEGQVASARNSLLRCNAILAALGERPQRSTTQALLARVYELLGERKLAAAALAQTEELSAPDDAINFAIANSVRARLALADADNTGADRLARSAVEHAFRTDFVGLQGEAKLNRAHVLRAIGQPELARSSAREALSLFVAKGDRPASDAAQSLLDQI